MKTIITIAIILFLGVSFNASALIIVPVYGCTDVKANNFNPTANTDDGSCRYPGHNGDPLQVGQPWGLNGYETNKIASTNNCPIWFPRWMKPCWDVSKIPNFVKNSIAWYNSQH